MERPGHQLMAVAVDRQLKDILVHQVEGALDKFYHTTGGSGDFGIALKEDCPSIVSTAYYLSSFTGAVPSTPGMKAVGLTLDQDNAKVLAILMCSYEGLKWSLHKLVKLTAHGGWRQSPEGSFERRVHGAVRALALTAKCLGLVSFLVLLCRGDHPDLRYRLTGLRMQGVGDGINNSSRSTGTNTTTSNSIGAGYSSAQLYVEGKKALWLALMGASAAATVTVDWQTLRYIAYHYVHIAVSALSRLRGRRGATATSTSNTSTTTSDTTDSALPHRGSGSGSNSGQSAAPGVHKVCSSCSLSPPEMPHSLQCGHVYCYMCAHTLLHTTPSSSNYNDSSGSGGGTGAACMVCRRPATSIAPAGASISLTST